MRTTRLDAYDRECTRQRHERVTEVFFRYKDALVMKDLYNDKKKKKKPSGFGASQYLIYILTKTDKITCHLAKIYFETKF